MKQSEAKTRVDRLYPTWVEANAGGISNATAADSATFAAWFAAEHPKYMTFPSLIGAPAQVERWAEDIRRSRSLSRPKRTK